MDITPPPPAPPPCLPLQLWISGAWLWCVADVKSMPVNDRLIPGSRTCLCFPGIETTFVSRLSAIIPREKKKKKGIKHTLRSNAFTFLLMKFNDGRSDTLTASNGGCFVPEEFIFQAVFLHHFCCGVKVWAATLPAVYNPRLQASFMDTFVLCWHIEFTPLISYMFHLIHLCYSIYLSHLNMLVFLL